jgi:hypothetical protein
MVEHKDEHPEKKLEDLVKDNHAPNPSHADNHGASHGDSHNTHKEKKKTALESVTSESADAVKNLSAFGAGMAFPFMFSGEARTNAMINAYPLALGSTIEDRMRDKPVNPVKSMKEAFVGTIMANPLAGLLKYINVARDSATSYMGTLPGAGVAVGALAAGQAAFVGTYMALNHVVQNMSFKGLYNTMKTKYWTAVKNTWKYVLPFSMWNVLYVYKFGIAAQMAYGSLMTFLFRLVGPKEKDANLKNLGKSLNPAPYLRGTASVTSKLIANPLKGIYEATSAIASSINDLYKSNPKAAAPAVAGAHH